jgi:hypothetical protein
MFGCLLHRLASTKQNRYIFKNKMIIKTIVTKFAVLLAYMCCRNLTEKINE